MFSTFQDSKKINREKLKKALIKIHLKAKKKSKEIEQKPKDDEKKWKGDEKKSKEVEA